MKHGFFLIDKPAGLSSAAVVAKVKRAIGGLKTGHAGTLDPMATGLLVVLFGSCTRLASKAEASEKEYQGKILFGRTTDSDDVTGATLTVSEMLPSFEDVRGAVSSFTGKIMQAPPRISAVKIDGERSYKLARSGEDVAPQPREVEVKEFLVEEESEWEVRYRVRCSKGTYIRSLARDLGEKLGCGGCLSTIRRTRNGMFSVDSAISIEAVTLASARDWWDLLPNTPQVMIAEDVRRRLDHGDPAAPKLVGMDGEGLVIYKGPDGMPAGFVELANGTWERGPIFDS
jgi:tRNA pseudouridine55 synthase